VRAAILTVSTSKARGEGEDESGTRLAAFAAAIGAEVTASDVVSDDRAEIESRLRRWADDDGCEVVLTTGGTGFAATDVTPEAILAVIDREAPGLAEAMRLASREHTPHWMLSRAVAGIRGSTLIVSFPGSPRSIEQAGEAIAPALPHALALIAGRDPGH
jgi:molybdenum cofactor synthesis domain-containing protein